MRKSKGSNYDLLLNNKDYKYKENDPDYTGNPTNEELCMLSINISMY